MWDEWAAVSFEDRPAIILRAYELAWGKEARERIALASGMTVPEATVAGLLPYRVVPALRKTDPFQPEDVKRAMIEQGASQLSLDEDVLLRFATSEEAIDCIKRLTVALPGSEPIWIVVSDIHPSAHGPLAVGGLADESME